MTDVQYSFTAFPRTHTDPAWRSCLTPQVSVTALLICGVKTSSTQPMCALFGCATFRLASDQSGRGCCQCCALTSLCRGLNSTHRFEHIPGNGGGGGGGGGERAPRAPKARGLCYKFRDEGLCEHGDACRFLHGDDDQRYAGEGAPAPRPRGPCYEFRDTGACKYGDQCRFLHEENQA